MAISSRRKKSNDGGHGTIVHARPSLPRSLESSYLAERAAEAAAKRAKRATPPEEPRKRGRKCATPEQQLLHIRALREYAGWTVRELAVFYSMPEARIHQITYYQVAGAICPIEEDVPADAVRPVVPDRRYGPRVRPAVQPKMAGTMATLEQARAQRAADAEQAALIETELRDKEAESRLGAQD